MTFHRSSTFSVANAKTQRTASGNNLGATVGNRYSRAFVNYWNSASGGTSTGTFTSTGQAGTTTGARYQYHQFDSSGALTVNLGILPFDVLLVAGGGGSGGGAGNGAQGFTAGSGGGGGVIQANGVNLPSGVLTVTVGTGGGGGGPDPSGGSPNGGTGGFSSITGYATNALGGGGGGQNGNSGGSGGAGGWAGGNGGGGAGTAFQGHNGQGGTGQNPAATPIGGGAGVYEASTSFNSGSTRAIDFGTGSVNYSQGSGGTGGIGYGGSGGGYYYPTPGNSGGAGRVMIRYQIG